MDNVSDNTVPPVTSSRSPTMAQRALKFTPFRKSSKEARSSRQYKSVSPNVVRKTTRPQSTEVQSGFSRRKISAPASSIDFRCSGVYLGEPTTDPVMEKLKLAQSIPEEVSEFATIDIGNGYIEEEKLPYTSPVSQPSKQNIPDKISGYGASKAQSEPTMSVNSNQDNFIQVRNQPSPLFYISSPGSDSKPLSARCPGKYGGVKDDIDGTTTAPSTSTDDFSAISQSVGQLKLRRSSTEKILRPNTSLLAPRRSPRKISQPMHKTDRQPDESGATTSEQSDSKLKTSAQNSKSTGSIAKKLSFFKKPKDSSRPSSAEIKQWDGVSLFRAFLQGEFSDENIEFWLACEEFKKCKSSAEKLQKAQQIYSDFVAIQSPKEVNLDSKTRESTMQMLDRQTSEISFEQSQARIVALMEKDSYPRFLKSSLYLDLLR